MRPPLPTPNSTISDGRHEKSNWELVVVASFGDSSLDAGASETLMSELKRQWR